MSALAFRPLAAVILLSTTCHLTAQDTGPSAGDPGVPKDRESIVRLQAFLDRKFFGPGKVDGATGEFTYKAVVNYNVSTGHSNLYDWGPAREAAKRELTTAYAAVRVREKWLEYVNPKLPTDPALQESFKFMAYRSLAELVAERFHTDETFLAKVNPKVNLNAMKPGQLLKVPNVIPFCIEDVATHLNFKNDSTLSANSIVIDTVERQAAIWNSAGVLLAAFPITPGKPQFIPVGEWVVTTMVTTPNFRYDKQFLEEGSRGDKAYHIPPGPNNPVGVLWAGLSKSGIGLHGTSSPRTIGRSQSAGCVRFSNWDAMRLPQLIRPGSRVIVR
ncbi:MAG: L,D-transpeptidase [Verrucomicrobiales bacterium]|nr:L,D-transpeptidase [Verrucomicrobiales bacterium]